MESQNNNLSKLETLNKLVNNEQSSNEIPISNENKEAHEKHSNPEIKTDTYNLPLSNEQKDATEANNGTLFNFLNEGKVNLNLLLVNKLKLSRGNSSLYKSIFSDGYEYLEISEWGTNTFEAFRENQTIEFKEYFLKREQNTSQYFVKMNKHNYSLIKTPESNLSIANKIIMPPSSMNIMDITQLTSMYIYL